MQALAWMKQHFQDFCDKSPMANRTVVWHLSPCNTKADIYRSYVEWCKDHDGTEEPVSLTQFLTLWDEEFDYVKIPETKRFKECTMYVHSFVLCITFGLIVSAIFLILSERVSN